MVTYKNMGEKLTQSRHAVVSAVSKPPMLMMQFLT